MMAISYLNTNYPVEIGFPSFLTCTLNVWEKIRSPITCVQYSTVQYMYTVLCVYSSVFSKASVDL